MNRIVNKLEDVILSLLFNIKFIVQRCLKFVIGLGTNICFKDFFFSSDFPLKLLPKTELLFCYLEEKECFMLDGVRNKIVFLLFNILILDLSEQFIQ